MLKDLPVEVLQQIAGNLPTAASIAHFGQVSHQFNTIVSDNDSAIFRTFVKREFPTIDTPPLWRDAAKTLTSRSRAWDRKAFVTRECHPPPDPVEWDARIHPAYPTSTLGYQPVIDSYETWDGGSWASRKEVLAWGAAGRLRTRTIKDGVTTWSSCKVSDDDRQDLDILDVRLLRSHQHEHKDGETILLRKADGKTIKLESLPKVNEFRQISRYNLGESRPNGMDVNTKADPLLALCDNNSIRLYPVSSSDRNVSPSDIMSIQSDPSVTERKRCIKFLSNTSIAVASQYLQGLSRAPIRIYDINSKASSSTPLLEMLTSDDSDIAGRHNANTIMPLDDTGILSGQPGRLVLSGWTDGICRLHDLRTPSKAVAKYVDLVDDGQIMSILPIGHERFVAGGHQNGCLKTFDLRITGAQPYSYTNARPSPPSPVKREAVQYYNPLTGDRTTKLIPRGINIFVTPTVNTMASLWHPLPTKPSRRSERYRGAIYSLSSPSPSSPTIYAGIANHVIQLDFISTDDYRGKKSSALDPMLRLDEPGNRFMELSCYERPRRGHSSTDTVLLRKQIPLNSKVHSTITRDGQFEEGWDERWHLETNGRTRGSQRNWNLARR